MAQASQKLKLLYLLDILMRKTDEEHLLTANDLCRELDKYGIPAERKAIYNDIAALQDYGYDILKGDQKTPGVYMASRQFELPELKLLVDAVQSSRFITKKKTDELIHKLEQLTSEYEAKQLHRQVYIYNRSKSDNETIYYHVDRIHEAISDQVQIRFQYGEWTREKKFQLKKNGDWYQVSPWALTWADEKYYLIAYDEKSEQIRHYRVDRMRKTEVTEMQRRGQESFSKFDLASFSNKTFGMFGGKEEIITLRCQNHFASVVLDRFGTEIMLIPDGPDAFRTRVQVTVSSQFFGWLTGLGSDVVILEPASIKEEYQQYLAEIMKKYHDE